MKRYQLKKDLPTFNAGDKFYLSDCGNLVLDISHKDDQQSGYLIVAYSAETLRKFPNILKDWFEEIPEKPKTIWDLEDGDKYFYIDCLGVISQQTWNSSFFDKQCRGIGNAFSTTKEAQKELAWRRAKQILLRDTKGFKPDWYDKNQDRFCVSFKIFCGERTKGRLGELAVENAVYSITRDLYFATQADADASIKAHEKEWKIYLGVEDD